MIIILLILHYLLEGLLQRLWNLIPKSKSENNPQITFDQSFVEIFLGKNTPDLEIKIS